MARGRGHRAGLEEIATELNLVPYLDMMTVLVLFLLVTITSFLSFTMLNASIPQLSPDSSKAVEAAQKKEQLLLMVRVTSNSFIVDPNVQGGGSIKQITIGKTNDKYAFEDLRTAVAGLKKRFQDETRVLVIAEPRIIYDDIVHTMDALREATPGAADLFPDVTLSIF